MALTEAVERIMESVVLNRVTSGLMYFRATKTGTLKNVYLYRSASGGISGVWYFNLIHNGAGLWSGSGRLAFNLGTSLASKTALSVAVTQGDVFQLNLEQVGSGTITGNLVLLLEIEYPFSSGTVEAVVAGAGIHVDNTDPANPEVSVDSSVTNALIPTGGTTGQVLTKDSGADLDLSWQDATGGGASDLDDLGDVVISSPSVGQVLTYDGSEWINDDPADSAVLTRLFDDDFFSSLNPKWRTVGVGGTVSELGSESGRPGIVRCTSTTGTFTVIGFGLQSSSSGVTVVPGDNFDITWVVRMVDIASDEIYRIGLFDPDFSNTFSNAIFFHKELATNYLVGECRASGSFSQTASFGTYTANTWVSLRLRRIDASTIGFSIDGGTEATLTTNIPSTGLVLAAYVARNSTGSKSLDVDRVTLDVE